MDIPYGKIPSSSILIEMAADLTAAARAIYDGWEQVDGFDEELGCGGICQDIASAMVNSLAELGVDHALTVHSSVGENHVFVVALLEDGVFSIDIPPQVYEIGSGYVWKKRENADFSPSVLCIDKIGEPMTVHDFESQYSDW